MPTWAGLTKEQKDKIYNEFVHDARPRADVISSMAKKYKIPELTLSRRLREHKQFFKEANVNLSQPQLGTAEASMKKNETKIVANPTDAHGVYADPYAWELALKCIELMKPDDITWGNDAMDFGTISTYARQGVLPTVREELADEKRKRKELKESAPNANLWWLSDNHVVQRYMRYIFNKAPELAELEELQLDRLLGFPKENMIEVFEAGSTLRVIHGQAVKNMPGASVYWHLVTDPGNRKGRYIRSVMMGHVHRFAHIALDNGLEGLECGCLQNLRPEYMKHNHLYSNWAHGMGFARYGSDWSQIIPARFQVIRDRLVCRLEGQEISVKVSQNYSGFA